MTGAHVGEGGGEGRRKERRGESDRKGRREMKAGEKARRGGDERGRVRVLAGVSKVGGLVTG